MKNNVLLKAGIFRISVVLADFIVLSLLLGDVFAGGATTAIRHFVQTIFYWLHERVWLRFSWGMKDGVEGGKRAIAKTATYRLSSMVFDFFLIAVFAGSPSRGAVGAIVITVINTALYYMMERVWMVVERREKQKAPEIGA